MRARYHGCVLSASASRASLPGARGLDPSLSWRLQSDPLNPFVQRPEIRGMDPRLEWRARLPGDVAQDTTAEEALEGDRKALQAILAIPNDSQRRKRLRRFLMDRRGRCGSPRRRRARRHAHCGIPDGKSKPGPGPGSCAGSSSNPSPLSLSRAPSAAPKCTSWAGTAPRT